MAVTGLVVTLAGDRIVSSDALRRMKDDPRLWVGRRSGARVPVVVDGASPGECERILAWLNTLEGVGHVGLVVADFGDSSSAPGAPSAGKEISDGDR